MSKQPTPTNTDQRAPEEVFIARMRRERERRGWSQARLAESAGGLHPTAVTKLEWAVTEGRRQDARNLRLNEAVAIAASFGLTVEPMLSDDDLSPANARLQDLYDRARFADDEARAAQEEAAAALAKAEKLREELHAAISETGGILTVDDDGRVVPVDVPGGL